METEKNKEKVFCSECKRFSEWKYEGNETGCKFITYVDTPTEKNVKRIEWKRCDSKNYNNDCEDFISKKKKHKTNGWLSIFKGKESK